MLRHNSTSLHQQLTLGAKTHLLQHLTLRAKGRDLINSSLSEQSQPTIKAFEKHNLRFQP